MSVEYTPLEVSVYDKLFDVVSLNSEQIPPIQAGIFLSKSLLSQSILSNIWILADNTNNGFLDRKSFRRALKLVAVAQLRGDVDEASLLAPSPLPVFEGIDTIQHKHNISTANTPLALQQTANSISTASKINSTLSSTASADTVSAQQTRGSIIPSTRVSSLTAQSVSQPLTPQPRTISNNQTKQITLTITQEERSRFIKFFETCNPTLGRVTASQSKDLFMSSQLSLEVLGNVWRLVAGGSGETLDVEGFVVAMLIITRLKVGSIVGVPDVLPDVVMKGGVVEVEGGDVSGTVAISDVIPKPTPEEIKKYESYFTNLDPTNKGYLTGTESYPFFLKSKLHKSELAKIWYFILIPGIW